MATRPGDSSDAQPRPGRGVIEFHLRDVHQLFDAMDPSPFREKDLDGDAQEYIVESVNEMPSREPALLVIHLDEPTGLADESQAIGVAVRAHFERQAAIVRRELRRLIHRGLISLVIGIGFLAALFIIGRLMGRLMGETATSSIVKEGLLIGGWVAMWRPLEIFLYDWWPLVGSIRINDRLSRIDVQVLHSGRTETDGLGRILLKARPERSRDPDRSA